MKKTFFTIALSTLTIASTMACGYGGFGINCRNFGELNIRDYNETQEHIFIGEIFRVDLGGASFVIAKTIKGEFIADTIYVTRPLFNPWNNGENLAEFKPGQEWLMFTSAGDRKASMYECSRSSLVGTKKYKRDVKFFKAVESTPNGPFQHLDSKGNVTGAGTFKNGLPEGTWRYYDEKGNEIAIANYEDGVRHGRWSNLNLEGIATQVVEYEKGGQVYSASFSSIGMIYSEQYNFETKTISRSFHNNGAMASENIRSKDGYTQTYRAWFDNGRLKSESSYKDGQQTGLWRTWDEAGKLLRTEDHRKDPTLEKG